MTPPAQMDTALWDSTSLLERIERDSVIQKVLQALQRLSSWISGDSFVQSATDVLRHPEFVALYKALNVLSAWDISSRWCLPADWYLFHG
jgi:hypothetical protein